MRAQNRASGGEELMEARHLGMMLFAVIAVAVGCAGCAKRPGVAAASAPAPEVRTDTSGVMAASDQGTSTAASIGRGERPSPRDFMSVSDLLDIRFDFDRSDIRPDMARVLQANARWLRAHPNHLILIEGHTDERGTNEYNLALGDRRAKSTMSYLVAHGIQSSRITILSYGEDRPLCQEQSEGCWSKNRRAHFAVKAQ
jgi:peptidoglycan-associated lipoprotein